MALLDTTVLVDLLRTDPSVKKLLEKLESEMEEPKIGAPTVQELIRGAHKSRNPKKELERLELIFNGSIILPFTASTAKIAGQLQAELDKAGTPVDYPDVQIAAIAKAADERIITRNARHFSYIKGVMIESY